MYSDKIFEPDLELADAFSNLFFEICEVLNNFLITHSFLNLFFNNTLRLALFNEYMPAYIFFSFSFFFIN